MTRYLVIGNFL